MAANVQIGSRWLGISGSVMEVMDVRDGMVRLEYVNDRDDGEGQWWETADDVVSSFTELI